MGLEILALRVIGKNFGAAIRETSIVISVFLLTMTLGYYFGGRAADRFPRTHLLADVLLIAAVSCFPIPALDRWISELIFQSPLPVQTHALMVTLTLFSVPTLFLATAGPIAVRLLTSDREHIGRVSGLISALSAAGSILGSLSAAFLLIDLFRGVNPSIVAIGGVLLLCFVIALFADFETRVKLSTLMRRYRQALLPAGALTVGFLFNGIAWFSARPPALTDLQEINPRNRTVHRRTTRYHSISVRDLDRRWRTLYFGRFAQSAMDLRDPFGPGFEYPDFFHLPRVLSPGSRNVLFIGLGGGTGPKQFLRDCLKCVIDVAEVDAGVVAVARDYFSLPASSRLNISIVDGRIFLKSAPRKYDVVVIDAFTTNRYGMTIPWHLTTWEFFEELASHMTQEGTVVYNSPAPPSSPVTRALGKTMALEFPFQMFFRTESSANTVILSSRVDIRVTSLELRAKVIAARQEGSVRYVPLEKRSSQLLERNPTQLGVPVLTDEYAPIDTLIREGT